MVKQVKTILLSLALVGLIISGLNPFDHTPPTTEIRLECFSSREELEDFVRSAREIYNFPNIFPAPQHLWKWEVLPAPRIGFNIETLASPPKQIQFTIDGGLRDISLDYSTTNIQVAGVDEADIVKTDGYYIYLVAKNQIFIIRAWPPEKMEVTSKIDVDGTPLEIFKNGNLLIAFGNKSTTDYWRLFLPPRWVGDYPVSKAFISIYDISDKRNPVLKDEITMHGSYFDSRMIGDHVYVVINTPVEHEGHVFLPEISSKGKIEKIEASEVYHFSTLDHGYRFTTVLSVDLKSGHWSRKVFLVGNNQDVYVSTNNIYLVYRKGSDPTEYWNTLIRGLAESLPAEIQLGIAGVRSRNLNERIQKTKEILLDYYDNLEDNEKWLFRSKVWQSIRNAEVEMNKEVTAICKISITDGQIIFRAKGEVPGRVLNQFSMDEYQGYFRIATTTGRVWAVGETRARNHIYVLDPDLRIVGKLENLAEGERIYSARFMGDRVYLVTFREVDPLFVIGLEDPANPRVLGELKIPGYSNYLHPYDETHLIGIGKDTLEWGGFVWQQGVKLALFDVGDPTRPKEISKYVIGQRGTESPVLYDHRAFLFSRSKNLLVLPVSVVENGSSRWWRGGYDWEGAYVFEISPTQGIVLKHKIDHPDQVKRSLYIENVLYTISDKVMKLTSLEEMREISVLQLS